MDLLEDLRMPFLNFDFVVIFIIHKFLVLLENHLNYFKDRIYDCFFKEYNFIFYKLIFSQKILMENKNKNKETE